MELLKILKALSDETRIRMLNLFSYGEMCVCEIEAILEINQSNASRHLNKLTNANIISYCKKAQFVYYKIEQTTLEQYPFIKEMLNNEVKVIELCKKDLEKYNEFKKKGVTCEDLKKQKSFCSNNN